MGESPVNGGEGESGAEFLVRNANADLEIRRKEIALLVGADPAGPLDPMRPKWRTNSYALSLHCWEMVGSCFVLASWGLRRNAASLALGYLIEAQRPIEIGHTALRKGIYLDHGGGVRKSEWHPALLLPDGYCRLFLDQPRPLWIASYSVEESVRQVDPQAKMSVAWGVVLHSLRAVWEGNGELARSLVSAAGEVSRTARRGERSLVAWMQQVPATALAFIQASETGASASLKRQLDLFKKLDKPEPDSIDTWIAPVGNDAHQALSVDWFASACCKLRPSVCPLVRGYSPFLWMADS